MKIKLISHTPHPEQAIIQATRTCYQSFDKQSEVSDKKLLEHIVKNEESPLEFASFTFLLTGISRITSHQIVRHRIASYAQKSQRYCKEADFKFIIPPSIKTKSGGAEHACNRVFTLAEEMYKELIELGVKKEDARYILPGGCATELVCVFNARSLRHFIKLRTSKKAQWEIKAVAKEMKTRVRGIAPTLMMFLDEETK